jgi:hypothetical protein
MYPKWEGRTVDGTIEVHVSGTTKGTNELLAVVFMVSGYEYDSSVAVINAVKVIVDGTPHESLEDIEYVLVVLFDAYEAGYEELSAAF